jgi:Acyltransferase family
MARADQSGVALEAPATGALPGTNGGYIGQFDSFRVIACCAVVLQHSLLWTTAAGNSAAWVFVMLFHFSRTAFFFFFLAAILLTYSQIIRPRSTLGFWGRRYVRLGVPFLVWTAIYWVFTMITGDSWDQAWSLLWNDVVYGYYQLYFAVVLLLYLVFPPVLRAIRASELVSSCPRGGRLVPAPPGGWCLTSTRGGRLRARSSAPSRAHRCGSLAPALRCCRAR